MKVLLVDDHSLFRHGMEMLFLMRLNFTEAVHAETQAEALANLDEHSDFDLVMLDYNLGTEDGLSAMAAIKARHPLLPIAMISGETNQDLILRALGEGAAGFISKNMHPKELAETITLILEGQIYIPELPRSDENATVIAAAKEAKERNMVEIAAFARRAVRNNDFSERITSIENCEVSSAFNGLMDELEKERSVLKQLAFVDELTRIANRRGLVEQFEGAMQRCKRSQALLALVYLDLDKFKPLNDTFGHAAGDIALVEIAQRLQTHTRELDLAARLGGDEFVVLAQDIHDETALRQYLSRLKEKLCQPIKISDTDDWPASVSIGATYSLGDEELATIMQRADSAMYAAKQSSKSNHFVIVPPTS